MNIEEVELLFAKRIMKLMEEAYDIILNHNSEAFEKRKFDIIKELSSLTVELLKDKNINKKMRKVAESSVFNGDDIDEKFNTFRMIRNVINHFPLFDTWDEVFISKDLLEWNNSNGKQIRDYFSKEKKFSYIIFLNNGYEWIPSRTININVPKLEQNNKIYLKDILSLDDALWTFGAIDYYLQLVGLKIEARIIASL